MKLSVVIPVYNSSSIIDNLTSDILNTSKNLSNINDIELILVNDCSSDDTWLKISKISEINNYPIGKELYEDFCMRCHMSDGKGVEGAYPPLANADYLLNKRIESIKAIKYGLSGPIVVNGINYNLNMEKMGLDNQEIAEIMNYILNSWGNKTEKLVTEKEVDEV